MNMLSTIFVKQAQVLQAMAHPKRLEIINLLRNQRLSVRQIQIMLGLRQAYLSQHLMVLRQAGVVDSKKIGKECFYRLKHLEFVKASDAIRSVIGDQLGKNLVKLVPLSLDPVCRMRVSAKTAGARVIYQGKTYHFCATGCAKKFAKKPEYYVSN